MSKARLNPNSNDYLTSFNRYNNYVKTAEPLHVITDNFTPMVTPTVSTFGDGKVYLSGSVTAAGTPTANYQICQLPDYLEPSSTSYANLVVVGSNGGVVANALIISASNTNGSIAGVNVVTPGSYDTLPSIMITGPGGGAAFSLTVKAVSVTVVTAQSGSGSYAPTNTVTLPMPAGNSAAMITVTTTKVVSATITAGGTGGTNGTQTVTGTTGTGTKFQASVTIAGGIITAILSITVAGDYTVNPTTLTAEPVTGAGLTGATLDLKMGILGVTISTPGELYALAANPCAQTATSGTGTGATFNVLYGALSVNLSDGGAGYTAQSIISLTGGGGTGGGVLSMNISFNNTASLSLLASPTVGDMVSLDGVSFDVEPYY